MKRTPPLTLLLLFLLAVSLLTAAGGCYLTKQSCRFLGLYSRAVEIDRALKAEDLPDDVRAMLSLTGEIREFAAASVGLEKNRNYTTYVETDKDYLVDVVSACKADRFEPYIWSFPLVGKMPYKGFFEKEDAEREAQKLRFAGYDVMVRRVDAFSTLGFFRDPVFSFMKKYPVHALAEVIIHEQAHATVFFRNRAQFNEELATFIGDEGALLFMSERYGGEPGPLREARLYREDWGRFLSLMRSLYDELDALYLAEGGGEYTRGRKEQILSEFAERYEREYENTFATENFRGVGRENLNNAFLQSFFTYSGDLSLFYELHSRLGSDLKGTVGFLKALKKEKGDPKEAIREYLRR